MACCKGLEPTHGGLYRANALGLGIPSQQPASACGRKPTATIPSEDSAAPCHAEDAVRVRGYEAACIPGFEAFTEDGQAEGPYATMRIIRSSNGYAIGSAVCCRTGVPTGFLLKVSGSGHAVVTPLRRAFSNGDVYSLVCPRGIVVRDSTVVTIVGEGLLEGGEERFPAIAHVKVSMSCSIESVIIILGSVDNSGSDSDGGSDSGSDRGSDRGDTECHHHRPGSSECYYDVMRNPANPCTVYVAGSHNGIAAVFLVHDVYGVIRRVTSRSLHRDAVESTATCLTLTSSRMLVIGVQTRRSSSLLWTLAADTLTELHTGTATAFNDCHSKRLRLSENCTRVDIIKVFALPCGAVIAVATAWLTTTHTNLPSSALAVYRFTEDTSPDMRFGVSGIVLWYDAHGAATRPCDALLHNETVYVVGNAYGAPDGYEHGHHGHDHGHGHNHKHRHPTYTNPCLSYLSVSAKHLRPSPFAVSIRPDGTPCILFTGLRGRAEGCFANTLTLTPGSLTVLTVLGDVWFHLQTVGQRAGLLVVDIALLSCPRILNNHFVSIPVINFGTADTCCVTVDKLCGGNGTTTLQVAGPIVVGKPPAQLFLSNSVPGAIAFDASTKTFLGFDGVSWKPFSFLHTDSIGTAESVITDTHSHIEETSECAE